MMTGYENFERERLTPIYDTVAPYSEMGMNERYFLNGIIRYMKPKKILEVGVSDGGGSAIILNAIRDIDGAMLYSVDYLEQAYKHPDKLSGWLVDEKFPELANKRQLYRGGDISRHIEAVGGDIDMLVLDTAHTHPWETLNFICILPFMKHDSWTVLHDITLYALPISLSRKSIACRYLYGHVVSDEKLSPVSDYGELPANIAAFKVSEVTMKYVNNLFESLFIPWGTIVSEEDIDSIKRIISKYYKPEHYKLFCDACNIQEYLYYNPQEKDVSVNRIFLAKYLPGLYAWLRRMKHPRKNK